MPSDAQTILSDALKCARAFVLSAVCWWMVSGAAAQDAEVDPDSPRGALSAFLEHCRDNDFALAGRYLDAPNGADREALAGQLKVVLDQRLVVDLEEVSSESNGDTSDGLPASLETLGEVRLGSQRVAIKLRHYPGREPSWLFSRATVSQIPDLYDQLPNRWLRSQLPTWMHREVFFDLAYYHLFAIVLFIALAPLLSWILGRVTRGLVHRLARATKNQFDDQVAAKMLGPLTLFWFAVLLRLASVGFGLPHEVREFAGRLNTALMYVVIFWLTIRLTDLGAEVLSSSSWATERRGVRNLLPLGKRLAKIGLSIVLTIAVLAGFGYPVTSLLAGLGVGGVAVALAAQKTFENLFGSFAIGFDEPFREGDLIRIDGEVMGTVERIGLRSTRIRTFERTLVTLPNSILADKRLESFTARDRMFLRVEIGLLYSTPSATLRAVIDQIKALLDAEPGLIKDETGVRLVGFADSAVTVRVTALFETSSWEEFQERRQEILFQIKEIVETSGSAFAFPSRTVYVEGESKEHISAGQQKGGHGSPAAAKEGA